MYIYICVYLEAIYKTRRRFISDLSKSKVNHSINSPLSKF